MLLLVRQLEPVEPVEEVVVRDALVRVRRAWVQVPVPMLLGPPQSSSSS